VVSPVRVMQLDPRQSVQGRLRQLWRGQKPGWAPGQGSDFRQLKLYHWHQLLAVRLAAQLVVVGQLVQMAEGAVPLPVPRFPGQNDQRPPSCPLVLDHW